MRETISVIVPVYNAVEHLERCLDSLVAQTYSDLEIILVDDGSTDGSSQLMEKFAHRDDRIRVLGQPNAGVSRARNVGLTSAKGAYVSFVDADDWLEPETYADVVAAFERQNADFVSFQYFVDQPTGSVAPRIPERFHGLLDRVQGLEAVMETTNRFLWTRVFRRELIGDVRFPEDLHWGEDTVFVIEVARRAKASFHISEPYYHYVQSEGSATRSRLNPKRLSGIEMTNVLQRLVEDDAPHLVPRVISTRANIFATLIQDAFAQPRSEWTPQTTALVRTAKREARLIAVAPGISPRTRLKAATLALSPKLFVALHNLRWAGSADPPARTGTK